MVQPQTQNRRAIWVEVCYISHRTRNPYDPSQHSGIGREDRNRPLVYRKCDRPDRMIAGIGPRGEPAPILLRIRDKSKAPSGIPLGASVQMGKPPA